MRNMPEAADAGYRIETKRMMPLDSERPAIELGRIKKVLWGEYEQQVWAVLDGARDARISESLAFAPNPSACLFGGPLTPALQAAAPYLVLLHPKDIFSDRLIQKAWGNAWCIFLRSRASLPKVRHHLKGFLSVQDERKKLLLFRFYDPRVLKLYLPSCRQDELAYLFGTTVDTYFVESESGAELCSFHLEDGRLASTNHSTFVP